MSSVSLIRQQEQINKNYLGSLRFYSLWKVFGMNIKV